MARQHRDSAQSAALATLAKGGLLDALKDAGSVDLQRLAKKLGNDDVLALMGETKQKRDELLTFVHSRLLAMGQAQQAEVDSLKARSVWWDEVSKGKAGYALPDPTRWHRPAELYRKVTEALCSGNLGRAAELLKQAMDAEKAAMDAVPVQVKIPADRRLPVQPPDALGAVAAGEGAPVTHAPRLLAAADRIASVTEHARAVRPYDVLKPHHWWEEPEEESEEAKKKKQAKKDEGGGPSS